MGSPLVFPHYKANAEGRRLKNGSVFVKKALFALSDMEKTPDIDERASLMNGTRFGKGKVSSAARNSNTKVKPPALAYAEGVVFVIQLLSGSFCLFRLPLPSSVRKKIP